MIKQVTKFETKDGRLFDTEIEALDYEQKEENSDKLYRLIAKMQLESSYTRIDECEVHDWFINNAKVVRETLAVWDK